MVVQKQGTAESFRQAISGTMAHLIIPEQLFLILYTDSLKYGGGWPVVSAAYVGGALVFENPWPSTVLQSHPLSKFDNN